MTNEIIWPSLQSRYAYTISISINIDLDIKIKYVCLINFFFWTIPRISVLEIDPKSFIKMQTLIMNITN